MLSLFILIYCFYMARGGREGGRPCYLMDGTRVMYNKGVLHHLHCKKAKKEE